MIEVVRGLGLGGAESLLATRLVYESSSGSRRTRQVINTYSANTFFGDRIIAAGVELVDLGTSSRCLSAWRLWRIARGLPHDETLVVHSPWPAAVLKLRRALRRPCGPVVEVAHSTKYAWPMLVLGRFLNRFATLCIAVSEDVAEAPSTRGFRAITVVEAGVDRRTMRQWVLQNPDAPEQYRRSLGLPTDSRLVVSVGSLLPLKRHSLLVRVAEKLGERVHVVIVGAGPERERLIAQAAALGVSNSVHLVGREPDAWRWMAVADIVAHPSCREGLPVALIEARALGVPAVAFDVGGVQSVLRDDGRSVVLSLNDEDRFGEELARVALLGSAADEFSGRAAVVTRWDVGRFANDFYERIQRG